MKLQILSLHAVRGGNEVEQQRKDIWLAQQGSDIIRMSPPTHQAWREGMCIYRYQQVLKGYPETWLLFSKNRDTPAHRLYLVLQLF